MKKVKEIQALNNEALESRLAELRKELMKYRSQVATGTIPKNPGQIRVIRKSIARILTVMNSRRVKTKA